MRFSSTNKCFYTIDTEENLRLILTSLRDFADIDISAISAVKERAEMKSASGPNLYNFIWSTYKLLFLNIRIL